LILTRNGIALPRARSGGGGHRFGGPQTDDKLARLRAYLQQFIIALKHQNFVLIYIDACAGSGERTEVRPALPLLDGDNAEPQIVTVPGSARLAIDTDPPFDRLVLIEKHPGRYAELQQLRSEFSDRRIECYPGDANAVVQNLCRSESWRKMRGVIFLDPYGMEIAWETVEAIASTKALDLWYWFSLMGLYRQAANEFPNIDETKRARLNWMLGTNEWERVWYDKPHGPTDLLDDPQTAVRTADVRAIERYVKQRLASIFKAKGAVLDPLTIPTKQSPVKKPS
jgi:three-Cys-motif partner protein